MKTYIVKPLDWIESNGTWTAETGFGKISLWSHDAGRGDVRNCIIMLFGKEMRGNYTIEGAKWIVWGHYLERLMPMLEEVKP